MHPQRIVGLCAAGAGMLGTFLPWVSLGGLGAVDGTRGDGWITLGMFAVALVSMIPGERRQAMSGGQALWVTVVALATVVAGLYDFSHIRDLPIAQVSGGLYLVICAAIVLAIAAAFGGAKVVPQIFLVLAGAMIVFAGLVHIPYGDKLASAKICGKDGWSLVDTFPNVDEFIGGQLTLENAKTVKALAKCGVLTLGQPEAQ